MLFRMDGTIRILTITAAAALMWFAGGLPAVAEDGVQVAQRSPRSARRPEKPNPAKQHPLIPVIETLERANKIITEIDDYSAVFVKRERIDGELGKYAYMEFKIRHKPHSVYLKYLSPKSVKGREAIYVRGQNDGKLVAHSTGLQKTLLGTISLDPEGSWAMDGNRHPITHAGIMYTTRGFLGICKRELKHDEVDVRFYPGAKVDGRKCTLMQVTHPKQRDHFKYHVFRMYIDDEWKIPVRTEDYTWPEEAGEKPLLMGEYTYTKLQFNVGHKDIDFDPKNPEYDYP